MEGDTITTTSNQTTQNTNTSDSSYPILFQLQTVSDRRNVGMDTVLSTPYARRKATNHTQAMKRVQVALALAGILGIVMVIFVLSFYLPDTKKQLLKNNGKAQVDKIVLDALEFDISTSSLLINNSMGKSAVKIQTKSSTVAGTAMDIKRYKDRVVLKKGDLSYTFSILMNSVQGKCLNISFESTKKTTFNSCVDITDGNWFGLGELYDQTWLLEKASISTTPFITDDLLSDKSKVNKKFGGVLEPYLLSSNGIAIFINRNIPLFVNINSSSKGMVCFQSKSSEVLKGDEIDKSQMQFTVCTADNIKNVHQIILQKFFQKSQITPDAIMLRSPVWSTWARFKKNVTQEKVIQLAKDIVKYNFSASHIEIDDKYSTAYGDFNFDKSKFNDAAAMIEEVHNRNIRVTAWVYPFANLDSKALALGTPYWVESGRGPGIIKWWNGHGAVLDTTNNAGVEWFRNRLKKFKDEYKIDSFKFDAGEVHYLPQHSTLNKTLTNINYYSTKYVELASTFGGLTEVRVGYDSQRYPVFTRIVDRTSSWGLKNGLKSVLTATLTFGILAYPFVLPDMVGGNAYDNKPDKELYIRWTQLSIFLPSIQFSIAPWDYDNETISIVQDALQIRENISSDILRFAKIAALTGVPIVRPLWWAAPSDSQTFSRDTEFMIGDMYLVAPVLEKGAQKREVYLVNGTWQEMFGQGNIFNVGKQGRTLNYDVGLRDIIYFKNIFTLE